MEIQMKENTNANVEQKSDEAQQKGKKRKLRHELFKEGNDQKEDLVIPEKSDSEDTLSKQEEEMEEMEKIKKIPFSSLFMQFAIECTKRSGDKESKVGCVITNCENQILSLGYNGETLGSNEQRANQKKEDFMVHAEMNAISYANCNLRKEDLIIYVTRIPCKTCMKMLCQYNIIAIFYLFRKDHIQTFEMAKDSSIVLIHYPSLVCDWENIENSFELKIKKNKEEEAYWVFQKITSEDNTQSVSYDDELNISIPKYIFEGLISILRIDLNHLNKTYVHAPDAKYTPRSEKTKTWPKKYFFSIIQE